MKPTASCLELHNGRKAAEYKCHTRNKAAEQDLFMTGHGEWGGNNFTSKTKSNSLARGVRKQRLCRMQS